MITKDALWKTIIEDLFEDFLAYFFPAWTAQYVDFTKPFEFLDAELAELDPDSDTHKKYMDRLVKIHTKQGTEKWLLLHIEVQGYTDDTFAELMFTYFYRIKDKWQKDIMAFALYTDEDAKFYPTQYQYVYEQTELVYKFETFKLLTKTEQELHIPKNPFSLVMRCARKAIDKKQKLDEAQAKWKIELVQELLAEGYTDRQVHNILEFIRYYINFDSSTEKAIFDTTFHQIQQIPKTMSTAEYVAEMLKQEAVAEAKAKAKAEAKVEAEAETKSNVFGMLTEGLSLEAIVRITKRPLPTIQTWKTEWEIENR